MTSRIVVVVVGNGRPTETDPGPRDFLYSTKYVYHKDKYFRTVYRTLKVPPDPISR